MLDQPAAQLPVAQRSNPERSFAEEVRALRLGDGEVFRGEGILAVTEAILQSGVAYVGGYQGAPVSHLVDVLVESQDLLDELGVHLETCTNEASAAALLGASINYPLRGCVTWKSIVGTNVAADAPVMNPTWWDRVKWRFQVGGDRSDAVIVMAGSVSLGQQGRATEWRAPSA